MFEFLGKASSWFHRFLRFLQRIFDANDLLNSWYVISGKTHALSSLARTETGESRERFFKESFEKYQRAIEIKPDKHEAFNNWGLALSDLAQAETGESRERFFKESFEKYQRATEIKPDMHEAFYNLACIMSLQGKRDECRAYLEEYFKIGGTNSRSVFNNDIDFDNVRQDAWFQELLQKAPEE